MNKEDGFKFSYALSLATQLGFLMASSITGFVLLGYWLDGKLGTSPILIIGGALIGIVLTIYEAYHMMKPLITKSVQK